MDDGDKVKLRCPACRGRNLYVYETTEATGEWEVRDGRLVSATGYYGNGGSITKVAAACADCNHQWRTRAATLNGIMAD